MSNNYATTVQLETYVLDESTMASLPSELAQAHLDAAAAWLDGVIASRYPSASLPLSSVTQDVTQCVCERAAFTILRRMKFDVPAEGSSYEKRATALDAWADRIAAGLVHLAGSTPAAPALPRVSTRTPLGWHDESEDDDF
jgi:hypothetical protein